MGDDEAMWCEDDIEDFLDCPHCRGDGMDPDNDYLLPCPMCGGSGDMEY